MGLFGKFLKKNTDTSVNNELSKIADDIKHHKQETNQYLQQMLLAVHGIETRQKETILQLDELYDQMNSGEDEEGLAMALVSTIGIIEDFYRLTINDPSLSTQSQMMWNAAIKAARMAGLEVIDDKGKPMDFKRHRVEGTAADPSTPSGYILQTLMCGYLYKNTVLRTSAVLVNKKEVD